MKTLLVPTDFSPNADKALNFAVQIAKKMKARIILVHACDLLELTFKDNLHLKKEYNRQVISAANEKLAAYCKSISQTEKVSVRKKLYNGLITDTILHAARVNKADMIVMGTLGNAGAKEKILGSKTVGVIGRAEIPVLAIPLLSEWDVPSHLLFTINSFTEGRKELVLPFLQLAALFDAKVTVLKFSDIATRAPHKYLAIERAGNNFARKLRELVPGITVQFVHLEGHHFEKSIQKFINQHQVDLLAMISHKRNFVKSLFHRSMTKKMAYHSSVPLLALPA